MKLIHVAGACLNQTPMDWEGNLANVLEAIREAKRRKIDLLCLPELAICGYGCEDAFFSGYILRDSLKSLETIITECRGISVSVGLVAEFENCLYNVTAFISNGELKGLIAKQDLAGDGVHYEPRWFKKWPKDQVSAWKWNNREFPIGDLIFSLDEIRIGFEICEDAWSGVRPAQDHYLNNVDIILNPSASHFAFGKTKVRELLVTETSRAFCCAYVYSNLLGNESGRIIYDGEILLAQGGELLARNKRFSYTNWQIVSRVIDVESIRRMKKKSFNFTPVPPLKIIECGALPPQVREFAGQENFMPEILSKEEEFYKATTLGLFDYLRKSRSKGFVISLSGGADSSACAVLAAASFNDALEELGLEHFKAKTGHIQWVAEQPNLKEYLCCVYQATENSSAATLQSAKEVASGLGAEFYYWDVQSFFPEYKKLAENSAEIKLSWEKNDIALQNLQARMRAPGIWLLANLRNAILLTTSNRSEAAVGYATMDGDTAGGLMPLGGVDKAFLQQWLRWAEKLPGLSCLNKVNSLQPSAELRPPHNHQTDEADLMPYDILDNIEKAAIRDYKSPVEVFLTLRGIAPDGQLKGWIRKFFSLWERNQWKRERYAPSFHLDDENLDPKTWCRFPILSGGFKAALAELDKITSLNPGQ